MDTSTRIEHDAKLAIITDKDPDGLEVIRHSTAHLLAYAVKELFPEAQVTIGPVIENGFYYDFSYKRPFTPEDLAAIEKRMAELAKRDVPITREVWRRDDAVKTISEATARNPKRKSSHPFQTTRRSSLSRRRFLDRLRRTEPPRFDSVSGPMKVAGAYWRGDAKNEMLQRIYGTAWAKKEEQEAYLHMLEEAEKRDHRKLGKQLDLFHLQDEAPGMVFWHPKGWIIWQQIEQYMRKVLAEHGYQEVRTPMIMDRVLWEKSGHWQNYKENMFTTESEKMTTR